MNDPVKVSTLVWPEIHNFHMKLGHEIFFDVETSNLMLNYN